MFSATAFCASLSSLRAWLSGLCHFLVVCLIRAIKWLEFRLLLLLAPWLHGKGAELLEGIGVIMHETDPPPEEENNNKNYHAVQCSNKKYDRVVNLRIHSRMGMVSICNIGVLGAGESYMDKLWDTWGDNVDDLSELVTRVLENNLMDLYWNPWNRALEYLELCAFNLQTQSKAWEVGEQHYDLGNDLYETMLDPWMQYTCGYWKNATNLEEAQIHKMELICQKLNLQPGMTVLDIGCGWGTLCKYMATRYGVRCVGITISEEGVRYGRQVCEGLPVEIRLQDYRALENETFDRIVSVGMFEHVGFHNYRTFFQTCRSLLKDDGIFLLHTIGRNHANIPRSDAWVHKYIFPNGNLPFTTDICKDTKNLFVVEDWHNFGPDYGKTLYCWRENFISGWDKLDRVKYDERFYRMWIFYLSIARALFVSRRLQLWQVVLSKDGLRNGYRAVR